MDFILFLVSLSVIIISIGLLIFSLIKKNKEIAKKASVIFAIGVILFIIFMALPFPEGIQESTMIESSIAYS